MLICQLDQAYQGAIYSIYLSCNMNIYLDIDGVILANDLQPAKHAKEFIKYITDNHTVYWLTTHCHGDADYTVNFINRLFDVETISMLKKIKPTDWKTFKTEAINFSSTFIWIEDDLFDVEKEYLRKHNVFDRWIEVDLSKNLNQLLKIITILKNINSGR
ncbi:MAG TPA: hypothetical protein ACFYEK_17860 [Candidatus Wunengus sp. YC60]|uniref:hypothetical protein n=1 Tax=Candidatus Wunengus sp. YC60 TaxID=3367697 RepID=UPI0040252767